MEYENMIQEARKLTSWKMLKVEETRIILGPLLQRYSKQARKPSNNDSEKAELNKLSCSILGNR